MELLKDIYKFDLKILYQKLTIDNFYQYFNIIDEIVKSGSTEVLVKQDYCDKILIFCLNKLFLVNDTQDEPLSTIILQYIQLCSEYTSKNVFDFSIKYFIHYFLKCIQSNNSNLSLSTTKTCDEIINELVEKSEEKNRILLKNDISFNLNQINLLNNFYNIIMQRLILKNESNDSVFIIRDNEGLLNNLIEIALKFLHEIDQTNINLVRLCVHTIEKLIKLNSSFKNSILAKCLEVIKSSYEELSSLIFNKKRLESHCEDINMFLLTTIADYIIVIENNDYLNKHQFWYLLQSSLVHTNALTRKRSLYLLKRTIDFSLTNKTRIASCDEDEKNTCSLFDSSLTIWSDFFLCIELFEETSIHVIKPCLSKIDNILEDVKNGKFHLTWLLVLLQRALTHESKFMIRWSLAYFYRANFFDLFKKKFYKEKSFLKILNRFIMGPLFVVLQESFLYYK